VIRKSALAGHAASIQDTSTCVGYLNLFKVALGVKAFEHLLARARLALEENTMISLRKRPHAPPGVVARGLVPGRVLAWSVAAFLFAVAAHSPARPQLSTDTIYGVTALDVARAAAAQGVARLRQYRDDVLKQPLDMPADP
jgi:hypothetical protein